MTLTRCDVTPSDRALKGVWLSGLLSLVAACSSARLTTDHDAKFDFSRLHAWDWAPQGGEMMTSAAAKTSERIRLDSIVRERVAAVLLQKGYARNADKADFQIAWSFGEWELQRERHSASRYGAVGLYYPGLHASNTHRSEDGRALPPTSDPYSDRYEQAKLDLVVIDPRTNRVVWHGNVTDQSDFGYYTAAQKAEVGTAIESLLERFPPAP